MPITITATFECADITEYDEVMSLVRDNEPIIIDISGHVHFDYSHLERCTCEVDEDACPLHAGHTRDDQTPAEGVQRPCTADPCIDPLCDTHSVAEWPLPGHEQAAQAIQAMQRAEWDALTNDIYEAMKLFAEFRGRYQRENFIGITGELARDAWSSAWGPKVMTLGIAAFLFIMAAFLYVVRR